jgi:cytochrome P450
MSSAAAPSHLNPVSPENLLNPHPLFKTLRESDPVHWSETVHGWLITRYGDVMNCFRDPRLSAARMQFFEAQVGGMGPTLIPDLLKTLKEQITNKDGAEHIRLRRQFMGSFTPQMVDSWKPMIRRLMEELVDQVQAQGRMDLVKAVSEQLPALVIAGILGAPAEDRGRVQAWSAPLAAFSAPAPDADFVALAREANTAIVELRDYLSGLLEQRVHTPGDDVLSTMLRAQEQGGMMTREQLVVNAVLLLNAGHLTTTDQLSNGVYDLLQHPEQLQKVRENPVLLRGAVEEMIRYNPPMSFMHRIALEDFQLRGRTIRKGDVVFLGMASANRDPEVFPDPDRFDITRDHSHSKHLTFAFGPHHCLGAGLARREMEVAVEVLLNRLPDLRLDEEQQPKRKCNNLIFRGFDLLPLRW